jgi:hypothetical protein
MMDVGRLSQLPPTEGVRLGWHVLNGHANPARRVGETEGREECGGESRWLQGWPFWATQS